MRDLITPAERLAPHDKLSAALRYLRSQSRTGYCLDQHVRRLPAQSRPLTVLDQWRATRGAK